MNIAGTEYPITTTLYKGDITLKLILDEPHWYGLRDIMGIDDNPVFTRNRISNQKEQTDMVLSAAEYLDTETILSKLPFVTVDEVSEVLARKDAEMQQQMEMAQAMQMPMGGNNPDDNPDNTDDEPTEGEDE